MNLIVHPQRFKSPPTPLQGANGDIPVAGDYDGDRITDVAVWQPGTAQWTILTAGSQFAEQITGAWGANGDLPLGCSPSRPFEITLPIKDIIDAP
jgi:hypothetical protein